MSQVSSLALLWAAALVAPAASAGVRVAYAPANVRRTDQQNCFIFTMKDTVQAATSTKSLFSSVRGTQGGVFQNVLNGFWSCGVSQGTLAQMVNNSNIQSIQEDRVVKLAGSQTNPSWGLDRIDQRNLPLSNTYNYDDNALGAGTYVFIADTGLLSTHNEFTGRVKTGQDFTGSGSTTDCHGHGTHVSGTAAGTTYGIAKKAWIVPVRVLDCSGSGTWIGVINGLDWVVQQTSMRPAVVSMSLGGGSYDAVDQAIARTVNAGVTVVVAAGNSYDDACYYSPARAPSAITVGSTTNTDAKSDFSNYGTCVDIFAPGSSILSSWIGSNTATNTISGTSMATPHVSGAAAVLLGLNPSWSPARVTTELSNTATPNKVTSPGTGSPNRLLYVPINNAAPASPSPAAGVASPSPVGNNDVCTGAIRLSCGMTLRGSTAAATADPILAGCTASTSSYRGVWYVIDVPSSSPSLVVSTAGSSFDTQLSVFSGSSCNGLTCAAKNDDDGASRSSKVTITGTAGKTYFIVVHGYSTSVGNLQVAALCSASASPSRVRASPSPLPSPSPVATMPNDVCEQAVSMDCGDSKTGSTQLATFDDLSKCTAAETSGLAVWYFIDIPAGITTLTVSTKESAFDTQLSIFEDVGSQAIKGQMKTQGPRTKAASCQNLNCAGSNDDAFKTLTSAVSIPVTEGARYFVAVHGFQEAVGSFKLSTTCETAAGSKHKVAPRAPLVTSPRRALDNVNTSSGSTALIVLCAAALVALAVTMTVVFVAVQRRRAPQPMADVEVDISELEGSA